MMITLQKYETEGASHGVLVPADQKSADFVKKLIKNDVITSNFVKPRNYLFHKKWFALVQFAYEHWKPSNLQNSKWKDVTPEKNFDRFREDITILCGYFISTYRIDGSVRIEAKSISFAKMDEEQFQKLFDATKLVVLKHILKNYTPKDLNLVVLNLEKFD